MLQTVRFFSFLFSLFFMVNFTLLGQENNTKIEWKTFEEVEMLMNEKPKKVIVYFYTDWCGWCKRMDKNIYSNANLASYLNENYYAVKFNAEQKKSVYFNGKKYEVTKVGNRFVNELALSMLQGELLYPATVLLDENYTILNTFTGYMELYKMEPILKYVGDGLYTHTNWDKWFRDFKPSWK